MKYNGKNLDEVLQAHERWINSSYYWLEHEEIDKSEASRADFSWANLAWTDLRGVNLAGACLVGTSFFGADLSGANLRAADLRWAEFKLAKLKNTNFEKTNLCRTNIYESNLSEAINVPFVPMTCPDSGAFVGWKKCYCETDNEHLSVIVKLLIPEDAIRSSSTGRKCRASKAKVLEIQTKDGKTLENCVATSMNDSNFKYEVGKTVVPQRPFCENRWDECESGIHFFINRQEAVDY